MDNEIESLWLSLGIKPDDPSASDAVDKIIKTVQSKLKSSIYGGKDGVITLPATIEGKFKNGREIDKSITDAYAAIYKKAKQMADESVSLTLEDIEDFKAQIDKFGKKTSKYKSSDIISNANNNLRQMLSTYQDYVNELRIEVSKIQKIQIKQTQKAKAQQKAKTQQKGETAYDDYLNKQEKYSRQAQGAKERKELFQELDEVRETKSPVKSSGNIRASSTNDYLMRLSEYSAHGSRWANELARTLREEVAKSAKTLVTYIDPSYKKRTENGRATTEREFLNDTIKAAKKQLKNSITQLEAGSEDITLDTLKEQAAVIKVLNKALGRTTEQAEKIITSAIENRYNGSTEVTQGRGKYKYDKTTQTKVGGTNLEEGQIKGAGPGHDNTQKLVKELYTAMHQWDAEVIADTIAKEMILGNEKTINKIENNRKRKSTTSQSDNKIMNVKTTPDYKTELAQLNGRTNEVFDAVIQTNKLTNEQTTYDKMDNVKKDTDEAKHRRVDEVNRDINKDVARSVKQDEVSGFNTNKTANKLIKIAEDINNGIRSTKKTTSKIQLPAKIELPTKTNDLYKKLADPSKILGLPKPDGRRKKISDGMKDENPPLSLVPVQDALKKSLAVIPGEFAKTLKESIHPSVKDIQQKIDRPEGTDEFKYDETMLRRLAAISNAGKEARRKQSMDYTPPPRTIIPDYQPQVKHSDIYASPIKTTLRDVFENFLNDLTGASEEYKKIVNASTEQQDKMAAERVKIWGMNNGRNPNDTGDIASMRRVLELYRNNKASIEQNPALMQKIKLTDPIEIDTTEITKAFNKALSGKNMRNAQMGGSVGKQILGAMRGFTFMPSIEKSRVQADGLNQILGIINNSLNSLLSNIQMHETTLAGMEESGQARFNPDGTLTEDSTSAARKTLADLEESKYVLEMLKADLLANEAIVKRTSGNYGQMIKRLSFASPILRDCNGILRNMNAGLDKNGKALKFQTRMAEILNYTFQLISRSIGQWFKRIISMLNPLNIIKNITGWIKSAFQDFGSYDTKWQRTMNVIKINFQRAIKPAMEWIAQKLVNIIGFFNIISMKVQEAFGQVPVDLFDQAGANAEKMRRELEKAANVTAGFDELHDIGSDNSGENDLLGDIYKPQLSDEWKAMAEEIGDLFAGLIKGEKTIGEVLGRIFKMVLELLGKIAKAIWDWFKKTALGKWLIDNWKKILATILAAFLAWKLLKIAGGLLWNALFGNFTGGAIGSIFGKIGGWILKALGATAFGRGIIEGITGIFTGSGGLLTTLKSIFVGHEAITAFGAWGETLGALFAQSLLTVVGVAIAGIAIKKGTDKVKNNTAYNTGLMEYGGNEKDKKSNLGAILGTTAIAAGGGALSGLAIGAGIGAIGGPLGAAIGAAIGGIAGLLATSLAPAFEQAEIAARNMNNEMQRIEYYEGAVKGAQSQVDIFDEQQQLLKQSLELSTQAVYDQGEKLGISKSRMDELVQATQNGTFTTDMLTGSETGLAGSLTDLAQKQEHTTEVTQKLEEAQKKLLKAQTELSIAQDVEAGNFELAAARIEVAEAQGVYSTEDATEKRIQLYKQASKEERDNLLQNLTKDQTARMGEYIATTKNGLGKLSEAWDESSSDTKQKILDSVGADTQRQLEQNMNSMDAIIGRHTSVWQKIGDTLGEVFGRIFGINPTTWTYNGEDKYYKEAANGINRNPNNKKLYNEDVLEELKRRKLIPGYAIGTNYVPNDGLAYLHQGEAVIPKKYNQPYQPQNNSGMENAINNLVQQVAQISNQVNQGIPVKGQFVQRGSDLVATVERANNRIKNNVLNNRVYAR